VVVVSSKRVVVLASMVVVVGMVSVVGTVDGIVTVGVVAGIVGMGTVLVDVDVVVIEGPELLVVGGWVVVTWAGVVALVPTVVDAPPAGAVVDVLETPGMGTPIPPAPGMVVVTRPNPVVSVGFSANRPMKSSRF
jgi:hypothetical protein